MLVDKGRFCTLISAALFTVIEDTCGRHDTIYGCCSEPNNFLRYGIRGTHSCFANFAEILGQFGLDRTYVVGNVNFFMSVPIAADGWRSMSTDVQKRGLCRSACRARNAGGTVKLPADAQSLKRLQPDADSRDHLAGNVEG